MSGERAKRRRETEVANQVAEQLEGLQSHQTDLERRKEQLRVRLDEVDRSRRVVVERSEALEAVYAGAEADRDWKPVNSNTVQALLLEASRATGLPHPLPDTTPAAWAKQELLQRKLAAAEKEAKALSEKAVSAAAAANAARNTEGIPPKGAEAAEAAAATAQEGATAAGCSGHYS